MKPLLPLAVLLVAVAACTASPRSVTNSPIVDRETPSPSEPLPTATPFHGGISTLWLINDMSGNVEYCPHPDQTIGAVSCRRLSLVSPYLPNAWPSPTPSPGGECPNPYKVIVNFIDKTRFVYGPCSVPTSIAQLRDAMTATTSG